MLDLLMWLGFVVGFAIAVFAMVAFINATIVGVGVVLAHLFKRSD